MNPFFKLFFVLVLIVTSVSAQNPEDYDENGNLITKPYKKWATGVYAGAYFPNSYPAVLYDGYGFDLDGNKNVFENSWMYEKIINQFGGAYGQPDYIADALGVPSGDWNFDESDMPTNMRYKTAFTAGFSGRYSVDPKNGVIINVIGTILKSAGNFTITTLPPPNSTQVNSSIQTFNIFGSEERLMMQAGFQHLFGKSESVNFFAEGGLHATLAIFSDNQIQINGLRIDLFEDYYDSNSGYNFYTGTAPVALGFGAFAGCGVNLKTSGNWMIQLVYDLSLENIKITYEPKLNLNNSVGLRAYYTL